MSNKKLLVALLGLVLALVIVLVPSADKAKVDVIDKAAQGVIEALPDAPPTTQPTTLPSPGGSQ